MIKEIYLVYLFVFQFLRKNFLIVVPAYLFSGLLILSTQVKLENQSFEFFIIRIPLFFILFLLIILVITVMYVRVVLSGSFFDAWQVYVKTYEKVLYLPFFAFIEFVLIGILLGVISLVLPDFPILIVVWINSIIIVILLFFGIFQKICFIDKPLYKSLSDGFISFYSNKVFYLIIFILNTLLSYSILFLPSLMFYFLAPMVMTFDMLVLFYTFLYKDKITHLQ
ncbi:MAG: hypothetical protein KF758_15365 [Anaerolineales bacterium]|nr:hypothetical protein [Anaerolineales bacterium]MBX3038290.1 hypothetical protein [Anaerolineales bacterium]